MAPEARA
ncbi:hypothetical protein CP082626L3_1195A, partial [Chlamydia psittaci 08-2626_L3]